jgi:hypothetical protein
MSKTVWNPPLAEPSWSGTPSEMRPHVLFSWDDPRARVCRTFKECHDQWMEWRKDSPPSTGWLIAVLGRDSDPAAHITDVNE